MVTDPDIADSPGHVLPIYIRPTESFGQDSYPLTNGGSGAATFSGIDITVQASTVHWLVLVGGTASRGIGPAAGVGFQATENDQDAMGSLFTDPNAQTYARGRLFVDRAYTGKVTTVFRLPGEFSIGAVARYQDGQPFARLIIEPDVPQGPVRVRAYPNGASRFTFTGTLDLRVQKIFPLGGHRLTAVIDLYNASNLQNEVEEIVTTGRLFRTPLTIQPPRSVHVGGRWAF